MSLSLLEEMKWRNLIHSSTPGIGDELSKGPATGYIGFDPTAPSLTIGNLVQVMLLSFWQRAGNRPIALMGGATGSIGDPSGKDKERELKSREELDYNLEFQKKQIEKLLDFESPKYGARIVNNYDFYKDMNVLDFLRKVGKNLTINYMMSKDSVKNRLESGLSFTEFSYQLLQAYDFQCLYKEYGCTFQMGGSDQWGNITSGIEFIRRNIPNSKAFAFTTPLLTKSDGSKFGKSTSGNIWLDPKMTSPYQFYQFWLNIADSELPSIYRYFSLKSKEEVESLESENQDNPRFLKEIIAEELTVRIHSEEDFKNVKFVSELLFNKKAQKDLLFEMSEESFAMLMKEIPSFYSTNTDINISDLLVGENLVFNSNGDLRRAIKNNALSINKEKVGHHELRMQSSDWIMGKFLMVENGKKNKFIIEKK